jgi:hypothetical protein
MVAAKLDDLVRTGQDLPPAAFAGEESRESRESSTELSFAQHVKQPGAPRGGRGLACMGRSTDPRDLMRPAARLLRARVPPLKPHMYL